jgi:uncharacterized membrane protein
MKIVIDALERIQGVEIYPIISLLIFFIFFVVMSYFVFNLDKGYISKMKNMPLEEDEGNDETSELKDFQT